MTLIQIVNTLLVLALPPLTILCCWILQFQIQRMPIAQRAALAQFSHMSVCYVEQLHLNSPDKKALATAYATDMFRLYNLPVPHEDILEVAIGSAMYEIKNG